MDNKKQYVHWIKKTGYISCILIITFLLHSIPADADTTNPQIHINSLSLTNTDLGCTMVEITDADNITVVSLNITWDPSVIQIKNINIEPKYSDFDEVFSHINNTLGILEVDAYFFNNEIGLSGDISLFQLCLKAIEPIKDGSSTPLTIESSKVYNLSQELIDHTTFPAQIHLTKTDTSGSGGSGGSGGGGGGFPPVTNTPPTAVITVSSTQETVDTDIEFTASESTDSDGDSLSYAWDFDDGITSTQENISHLYTKPGIYTVHLTVTDTQGASNTTKTIITIQPKGNNPPSKPVITGPEMGSKNTSYTFQIISSDLDNDTLSYAVTWDDGSQTITGYNTTDTIVNLTHQWQQAGIYTITLVVYDENNGISPTTKHVLLIDAVAVKEIGYLLNTNEDDVYDNFSNKNKTVHTSVAYVDGLYRIDVDADNHTDYTYNMNTNDLIIYEHTDEPLQQVSINSYQMVLIIGILLILIVIIIIVMRMKKRKT